MNKNIIEIIGFCILGFFMIRGYLKGFILSIVDFSGWILAIIGGFLLSPILVKFLVTTSAYSDAKNTLMSTINFHGLVSANTIGEKTSSIEGLNLPSVLTKTLLENNNPDIYKILNVSSLQDYVVTLIMNIVVHIIAFSIITLLVFLLIFIIKLLILPVLKLPIIGSADKILGCVIGIFKGVILLWILMLLIPIVFKSQYSEFMASINSSKILSFLYSNNLILKYLLY